MTDRPTPSISARKRPRQARSTELVAAILQAAIQVLAKDGAARFTTARVAERAGVSVGSVYQYFPNKAAILFRLQTDEWRQTSDLLRSILSDRATPPAARLHALVHAFVRSECEEAAMRSALDDAAPLYCDAPEARDARPSGADLFQPFLREVVTGVSDAQLRVVGTLMAATLGAIAKRVSDTPRAPEEIETWAGELTRMLGAYLDRLAADAGANA